MGRLVREDATAITPLKAIVLAGQSTAGKTTVALELQNLAGLPRVAFGDYVRKVAAERGISSDRKALQDLGLELLQQPQAFCEAVLAQAGDWKKLQLLIIEGVRHVAILEILKELYFPDRIFLAYLDAPKELLFSRRTALGEAPDLDRHTVESDIEKLRLKADIVIDTTRPAEQTARELLGLIEPRNR